MCKAMPLEDIESRLFHLVIAPTGTAFLFIMKLDTFGLPDFHKSLPAFIINIVFIVALMANVFIGHVLIPIRNRLAKRK